MACVGMSIDSRPEEFFDRTLPHPVGSADALDAPPPPAKAWSPIPVSFDGTSSQVVKAFVPLGAPVATSSADPSAAPESLTAVARPAVENTGAFSKLGASLSLGGLAAAGHQLPTEVFPNAPKKLLDARSVTAVATQPKHQAHAAPTETDTARAAAAASLAAQRTAQLFANPPAQSTQPVPSGYHQTILEAMADEYRPRSVEVSEFNASQATQSRHADSQARHQPETAYPETARTETTYTEPTYTEESTTHGLDWRFLALCSVFVAYLPLAVRALMYERVGHPLAFTVVAFFLTPLVFAVAASKRSVATTPDDRAIDLAIGTTSAMCAVVLLRLAPSWFGARAGILRPDWLSFPFALFAAYTLLFGVRCAWKLRASLAIAAAAGPIMFLPLLARDWTSLTARLHPLAERIAGMVGRRDPIGHSSYVVNSDGRVVDLGGLVNGRMFSLAALITCAALILVSRERATGYPGRLLRTVSTRTRKFALLAGIFVTSRVVELGISALVLGLSGFTPSVFARVFGSSIVGLIPTLLMIPLFVRGIRRFSLELPSKLSLLDRAALLPSYGPHQRNDHALTAVSLAIVVIVTVWSGLRSSTPTASEVGLVTTLATPFGWQADQPQLIVELDRYYGPDSSWTRTRITPTVPTAALQDVYVDRIAASPNLLDRFTPATTFDLGLYQPMEDRQVLINLPDGKALRASQETYYDTASQSAWTVMSVRAVDEQGRTHRLSVSGRSVGSPSQVPVPRPAALQNILLRSAPTLRGPEAVQQRTQVQQVEQALSDLLRAVATTSTTPSNGSLPTPATPAQSTGVDVLFE
jgi:hypothetical protein